MIAAFDPAGPLRPAYSVYRADRRLIAKSSTVGSPRNDTLLLVLVLLCRSVLLCAFVVNSVRKLYMPLVNRAVAALVVVAGILGLILIANEVF